MKAEALEQYEHSERQFVRSNGHTAAINGYVTDATRIYSDRATAKRLAFHRAGAPLSALLFFYEQTVVYFPPNSRKTIERRLGMKWNDVLALVDRGCIQPIIGHPVDYADKGFFDDLLSFNPPSVWARGDELAHSFANAAHHWDIARASLPLDVMTELPWIRNKYRKHFPRLGPGPLSERIATEICTNYVDLCIYGFDDVAHELSQLEDVSWGARRILELSELLTYPTLMGMGGTANYGLSSGDAVQAAADANYISVPDMRVLPPEASLIVDGLAIGVPGRVSADLVVQFHHDNMSARLWRALGELEERISKTDDFGVDGLVDSAVAGQEILAQTMREVLGVVYGTHKSRIRQRVHPWTDLTVKLGSTAAVTAFSHTPLGLDWLAASAAGATYAGVFFNFGLFRKATKSVEDRIVEALLKRKVSALTTQLWWLTEWAEQNRSDGTHPR